MSAGVGDMPQTLQKAKLSARVGGFAIAQEENSSKQHEIFVIDIRWGRDKWRNYRRYSQFLAWHDIVKEIMKERTPAFPGKHFWGKHNAGFLETRRTELDKWMVAVVEGSSKFPELRNVLFKFFNDPEGKVPPAGLGTIITTVDVATGEGDVDAMMEAEKRDLGEKISEEQEAREKAAREAELRRLQILERQAEQKEQLEKLEAQRDACLGVIQEGDWFVKHSRRCRPKRKYVCIVKSPKNGELELCWKADKNKQKKSSVLFSTVTAVLKGKKTVLFESQPDLAENLCFSLKLEDAYKESLDLEATSVEQRDRWAAAFEVILSFEQKQSLVEEAGKALLKIALGTKKKDHAPSTLEQLKETQSELHKREEKMQEAELASEQLANSALSFENVARQLNQKQNDSMFGQMASALDNVLGD